MPSIRVFLLLIAIITLKGSMFAADPRLPNVVFILADDLGIGNMSCYGSDNYQTPNIDKLASDHGSDDYMRFNGSGVYWNNNVIRPLNPLYFRIRPVAL